MDPFTAGLVLYMGMNTLDMFSGMFSDGEKVNALKREKERKLKEKQAKLDLMDLEFKESKKAANKNADRSDQLSDMNEGTVSNQHNNAIEQLSLQQIADAYSFNYMAENSAAQTGNALSSQAASGTRNSSVMDAVELQAGQSAQQLQLSEDQQRAGYDSNLNGILSALAQNRFQIQNNRTDAIDLRTSYEAGGSQYEIFQKQRQLQSDAYDNLIEDINYEIEDNSGWKAGLKSIGRLFGVKNASSAFSLGQTVADFSSPKLNTQTNYSFDNVSPTKWEPHFYNAFQFYKN